MKRFSIPLSLALTALSLISTGTASQAGERPIRAEGLGRPLIVNEPSADLIGLGRSEHLGQCSLSIHLNFNELLDPGNVLPTALMLEAANGDRLIATVVSEFDPVTGIVVGTITFMQGTGRFADVTGSARLLIVPDSDWFDYVDGIPYPNETTRSYWALDGTIDY